MRSFTFITFAFLAVSALVGCTSPVAQPPPESTAPTTTANTPDESCRSIEPVPVGEGVELVLQGVARAQTNDLRCGPPPDQQRICRSLFVLATIDPASHLGNPEMLRRTSDAVDWAIADAASVSPPELAGALGSVQQSVNLLNAATEDDERIEALVARADRETVEALVAHWVQHCD